MKISRLIIPFLISMATSLMAQQTITGNVIDNETKEPLIGATIIVRSIQQGTAADPNGHFVLALASEPDTLEVSFVGYETQKIARPANTLSISLAPSVSNLQPVI